MLKFNLCSGFLQNDVRFRQKVSDGCQRYDQKKVYRLELSLICHIASLTFFHSGTRFFQLFRLLLQQSLDFCVVRYLCSRRREGTLNEFNRFEDKLTGLFVMLELKSATDRTPCSSLSWRSSSSLGENRSRRMIRAVQFFPISISLFIIREQSSLFDNCRFFFLD
jgi:hypothetical protein